MIERERRFLVEQVPSQLPRPQSIEQAYLTTKPVSVRVRRSDRGHMLTIKAGSGRNRTEIERSIDSDEFAALWDLATELRISKRRYELPLGDGLMAELDLFDGALAGRMLVEVEFDDDERADAFQPPAWFGREVTDDSRYTNSSLARDGWPEGP